MQKLHIGCSRYVSQSRSFACNSGGFWIIQGLVLAHKCFRDLGGCFCAHKAWEPFDFWKQSAQHHGCSYSFALEFSAHVQMLHLQCWTDSLIPQPNVSGSTNYLLCRRRSAQVGLEKTTRFYQASTSELYGMVQDWHRQIAACSITSPKTTLPPEELCSQQNAQSSPESPPHRSQSSSRNSETRKCRRERPLPSTPARPMPWRSSTPTGLQGSRSFRKPEVFKSSWINTHFMFVQPCGNFRHGGVAAGKMRGPTEVSIDAK